LALRCHRPEQPVEDHSWLGGYHFDLGAHRKDRIAAFRQDLGVYELEEYKAKYQKYEYVHLRSIDADLITALFPEHQVVGEELITDGMELMEFKPYPVKVMELAAGASKYVPESKRLGRQSCNTEESL